jgi:hypothetical protein
MRYATAAYGNSIIRAMGVTGRFDNHLNRITQTVIMEHVGVPENDIALLDVDHDGSGSHLRHFVAVDHEHKRSY